MIKPQIADTEQQEAAVAASDLDWVLVQPVHLHDGSEDDEPFLSATGETERMKVSRNSVGRFLAAAVERRDLVHKSVTVSGRA